MRGRVDVIDIKLWHRKLKEGKRDYKERRRKLEERMIVVKQELQELLEKHPDCPSLKEEK